MKMVMNGGWFMTLLYQHYGKSPFFLGQTHGISMAVPGVPGTQRILPQEAEVAPERREAWRFLEDFAGDLPRS